MQRSRSHTVVCKCDNARVCTMQLPQDHHVIHSQQIPIRCAVCVQPESVSWVIFETTEPKEFKFWPLAQHDLCQPTTEIICGLQILLVGLEITFAFVYLHIWACVCLCVNMSVYASECVCEYGPEHVCGCVHHSICVWVRGQLVGSGFFSPCGSRGSNSGHKDWERAPLHTAISPAHLSFILKKRMQECFLCLGWPLPRTHYCWVQPSAFVPKCLPLSGAAEEGVGTDFYGFQLLSSSSFSLFSIFIFSFCSYVAFRTPGKHNILNGQSFGKQKLLLQITSALGAIT